MKHDKRNIKLIAMIVMLGICATALTACLGKCSNKGTANETVESVIVTESVETTEASEPTATPTVAVKPTVTPKPTAAITPATAVTEDGDEGTEATTTATATPTTAETKPTAAAPTEAPATQPAATEAPAPTEAPATQPTATPEPTATPTPEPTATPTPEPTEAPADPWEGATYCTVDVNVRVGVDTDENYFTLYGYTAKKVGGAWQIAGDEYDRLMADIQSYAAEQNWNASGWYYSVTNNRDPRTNP